MTLKKREKTLLKVLGVVAVIGAIILLRTFSASKDDKKPEVITSTTEQKKDNSKKKTAKKKSYSSSKSRGGSVGGGRSRSSAASVSMGEFKKHTRKESCWVLMDGDVYNISGFFHKYPNYLEEAKKYCGTVGFEAGFLQENKIRDSIKAVSQKVGKIG